MLSKKEILDVLKSKDIPKDLLEEAFKVRKFYSGYYVYLRALTEITNICRKSCFYCGIRKENTFLKRYYLKFDLINKLFTNIKKLGYSSIALQGGEIFSEKHYFFLYKLIKLAKDKFNYEITISFGELPKDVLEKLYFLGAKRYLLRFEIISPKRYYLFHYKDKFHNYENRIKTLVLLKKIGYQVGTGNLIGLPFTFIKDLYKDILFIKNFKPDMVGIGPYIPQKNTPLFNYLTKGINIFSEKERFLLTLKLIAIFRILLKTSNIVASTALITLGTKFYPLEKVLNLAFKCGANVIMPIFTPSENKRLYSLYEDKYFSEHEKFYFAVKNSDFIPVLDRYGNPLSYYIRNQKSCKL